MGFGKTREKVDGALTVRQVAEIDRVLAADRYPAIRAGAGSPHPEPAREDA